MNTRLSAARFAISTLCALFAGIDLAGPVSVKDDLGNIVTLNAPASRIVTLAPSVVEVSYAAGAGDKIVATVEYSDYPASALKIPRVGGHSKINLEAVVAAKPDLVIAWESGNSPTAIDKLRQLGIPVFMSQPHKMTDIPGEIELIGVLAGTSPTAKKAADDFRKRYQTIANKYRDRSPVTVFYQVWQNPLITIGGQQIMSDAITLCRGENIFGSLKLLAPRVSFEAVIAANPEAIVTSGMADQNPEMLDAWKKWPNLTATQRNNFFFVQSDLMNRSGPRILDGTKILCEALQTARDHRPKREAKP
ncbi:MAG: Vitamin B12 ABC transporter, B12-binding component BtuF [Fluviibacter phosphoraccumulans EoVTN8]